MAGRHNFTERKLKRQESAKTRQDNYNKLTLQQKIDAQASQGHFGRQYGRLVALNKQIKD